MQPIDELIDTVQILRERCAWTRALTHESLRSYLIEESYEVLDAIAEGRSEALAEELGDLLFQIVLHARIEQEQERFDLQDVARSLNEKLLRRNRHVFDEHGAVREDITEDIEQIIRVWDAAKQAEKAGRPASAPRAGLPAGLPSLSLAQKLMDRSQRAGAPAATVHESVRGRVQDETSLARELMQLAARAEELNLDAESVLRQELGRRFA